MKPGDGFKFIGDALSSPLSGGVTVSVLGNSCAIIDGTKSVLEYDECMVRLRAGRFALRVMGTELDITDFSHNRVIIRGCIHSFDYEPLSRR